MLALIAHDGHGANFHPELLGVNDSGGQLHCLLTHQRGNTGCQLSGQLLPNVVGQGLCQQFKNLFACFFGHAVAPSRSVAHCM